MKGEYYIGLFMATVRFNLWGHKGVCKQINLNKTLTGLWHEAGLCYAYKDCERLAEEEKGNIGKQYDVIDIFIVLFDWWVSLRVMSGSIYPLFMFDGFQRGEMTDRRAEGQNIQDLDPDKCHLAHATLRELWGFIYTPER